METFFRDLHYSFRAIAMKPSFTAVAVVTLALGIGANTTMFSVIHGVLLRPLPFPNSDQIVTLRTLDRQSGGATEPVSPLDFRDWREQNRSFTHLAAFDRFSFALAGDQGPIRLRAARVSGDFFAVMGSPPAVGRTILPKDDRPGEDRVVVLSDHLWQNEFGADLNIVGKTLTLNGEGYTVVGIMPAGFEFPVGIDLWAPLALLPSQLRPSERGTIYLQVVGRLRPNITLEQSQSDMSVIASRLESLYSETNQGRSIVVTLLHEYTVGEVRPALVVLFGAVALVLLIACANVANLLLVRSASRQKELAIRAALGAGVARIVRHLLAESTLLGLMGGAGGVMLALWGLDLVRTLVPEGMPRLGEIDLDWGVLGFTLVVGLGTGILTGLAPALMAARGSLHVPLRVGVPQSGLSNRHRLRDTLVVAEVALALALLIGGALLIQSFLRLRAIDPGFDAERVLTAQFELFSERYGERSARVHFYRETVDRVSSLPGVRTAALITSVPLQDIHYGYEFMIDGRPTTAGDPLPFAGYDCITPDYFRVMEIRLVAGRPFTDADGPDNPPVVIINDTMSRLYWPGEDPVGQKIKIRADLSRSDAPGLEIVGVVEGARTIALDRGARPEMFFPYAQRPWRSGLLVMRTDGSASEVVAAVRTATHNVDKDIALSDFRGMEDYLYTSAARPRFRTALLSTFAALALILAAVGVYGVVAYSVGQRSHEIGVRMALGAQPGGIFRSIAREGLRLALSGVAVGLVAAFGLTRFLSNLLFGVEPTDVSTFAFTSVVLIAIVLLACYEPARRATKVDPIEVLRSE